jgi:hypothetical protein
MSMATRIAQEIARGAESEWKRHAGGCPRCSRLNHDRSAEPCGVGAEMRNESARLRTVARKEARLDRMPFPGQSALF